MTLSSYTAPLRRLLVVTAALALAGCGESDPLGVYDGGVRFVLSADVGADAPAPTEDLAGSPTLDGPVAYDGPHDGGPPHGKWPPRPWFASANVTFSSILARNLDGVLVDVAMELPVTVDVASMEDGRQIVLPDGELPPATYDQVVVVMTGVEGVTHDGTTIAITPPGGGWTAIVPICPFVVEEGATTVVGLTLDIHRSFLWRDSRFHFQPRFVCDDAEDEDEDGEGEGG